MIGPRNTVRINKPLINCHLDEVRRFRIILLAEGNNLAHGNVIPVGEWTNDMRNFTTLNRLKMRVYISHVVYYIPVILPKVRVFYL